MTDNKKIDMEQAYKLFFFATVHKDLHELTDAMYTLTGHPTLVSNNDGIKLSQSPDHEIGDKDWDYLLHEGRSSSRQFLKFIKNIRSGEKQKVPAADSGWRRIGNAAADIGFEIQRRDNSLQRHAAGREPGYG